MRQVFEQYASAVIAVLIATTILFTIAYGNFGQKKGLSSVLGQVLGYSVSENNINQNEAFDEYMSGSVPTIIPKEDCFVLKNTPILLSDCFEAKSNQGSRLPVYLQRAWGLDGEEVDLGVASDRTSIYVSEAGVYWLQLYAVDSNQKRNGVIVKLLVNER